MIKSFSLFESLDSGYFIDMLDQLQEEFPNIKFDFPFNIYGGLLSIYFIGGGKKDLLNLIDLLDFWINILDNNGYQYHGGDLKFAENGVGVKKRDFRSWEKMKGYILQFGNQDHISIRDSRIWFNV